ncbi:MAG: hypothetical protein ACN6P8_14585, partial [Achromobacter piechaudii]
LKQAGWQMQVLNQSGRRNLYRKTPHARILQNGPEPAAGESVAASRRFRPHFLRLTLSAFEE